MRPGTQQMIAQVLGPLSPTQGSWLQPGSLWAVAGVWEANQWMQHRSICSSAMEVKTHSEWLPGVGGVGEQRCAPGKPTVCTHDLSLGGVETPGEPFQHGCF